MNRLLLATLVGGFAILGSAHADAAKWTIKTLDTNYTVCTNIEAPGAPKAYQACIQRFGVPVPLTAVVTTTSRVCKSTHSVTQTSPALVYRWVYDSRFSYVTTPNCP